ncbi:glycerophosphodiester phosphodiesterase [Pseudobdellovibrio exovorus]|uniref:GP-PDE domain-containing protein n=1 Tax=Pseudobdellovibrio exovorus JSS TaxID=1184267 RepID=M4V8T4_9BACT|nr:glycerophosphodiester phosphodiesterase [Pseudobdellovibrio exovorus]AGH95623.1 hypothetical protein A11Q_1407 [Pseudobdellovibrio exovorus JSS]
MIWLQDDTIKEWLPRLQAHRGYHEKLEENTIEAIQAAHVLGYKMCEFDVRMTLDKEVVLFHDPEILGQAISSLNYNELRSMRAVTKLDEVLLWLRDTKEFKLNIEIKSTEVVSFQLEKKVCELVARFNLEDRVLVSSFNPVSLYKVRLFNSKIFRALLLSFEKDEKNTLLIRSGFLNYLAKPQVLHLRAEDYSRHFRNLGKKIPIVLWTVNDPEVYLQNKAEVHGIISDKITPELFSQL